jgi:hypothetical protein
VGRVAARWRRARCEGELEVAIGNYVSEDRGLKSRFDETRA